MSENLNPLTDDGDMYIEADETGRTWIVDMRDAADVDDDGVLTYKRTLLSSPQMPTPLNTEETEERLRDLTTAVLDAQKARLRGYNQWRAALDHLDMVVTKVGLAD